MLDLALIGAVVWVLSLGVTRLVLAYLRKQQIMDMPNERSSHNLPTPRGGGLAVTPVILLSCLILFGFGGAMPTPIMVILGCCFALATVSWIDDRRDLSPLPRFAAQIVVATIAVSQLSGPVLQGLVPLWFDQILTVLALVWFINLYNFMDGIDGITGVQSVSIGSGLLLAALTSLSETVMPLGLIGLVVAAASLGFLFWNWHPAKLFLGDVGSIPLGCLLGFCLLDLAASGLWAIAVIVPLYYLADATLTLLKRAARKEKVWKPHRQHFYQRATQRGWTHAQVSLLIAAVNGLLLILAFSDSLPLLWKLGLSAGLVTGELLLMYKLPPSLLDTGSRQAEK